MKRRDFIKQSAIASASTSLGADFVGRMIDQSAPLPPKETQSSPSSAGSVLSLPEGGGAVKGIGETFQVNPFTGSGNLSFTYFYFPGQRRNASQTLAPIQYRAG